MLRWFYKYMIDLDKIFPNYKKVPSAENVLHALPRLDWEYLCKELEENLMGDIHETAIIGEHVSIGEGTKIGPFVVIEDHVVIGQNCEVRSGALIRSHTFIGNDCVIGHNAEIKHAYVFDKAKIQCNAFVGDSIVGYGARIGTGVVIGNRRFDQKPIAWSMQDGKKDSTHDKLGALIGDYVRLGANVSTNPGTVIGAYTWVSGGNSIGGYIPNNKFIKPDGTVVDNDNAGELKEKDKEDNL